MQVIALVVLNSGLLNDIEPEAVPAILNSLIASVHMLHVGLVKEMNEADSLSEQLKSKIVDLSRMLVGTTGN